MNFDDHRQRGGGWSEMDERTDEQVAAQKQKRLAEQAKEEANKVLQAAAQPIINRIIAVRYDEGAIDELLQLLRGTTLAAIRKRRDVRWMDIVSEFLRGDCPLSMTQEDALWAWRKKHMHDK